MLTVGRFVMVQSVIFAMKKRQVRWDASATLRAHYDAAYLAALSGACLNPCTTNNMDVENAHKIALETVRQWDAMMAELEEI